MENWADGTLCWRCSRLATCSRVSRDVEECEHFIKSYVPKKEVAEVLGMSERNLYRVYKIMPRKIINAVKANDDERIIIDEEGHGKLAFFRKDNGI